MVYFLVNARLSEKIRVSLGAFGECIPLPPLEKLPYPVGHHPDMLIAQIHDALFVHREYTEGQRILQGLGVKFHLSQTPVGKKYPADIPLNCFCVGNCLLGKLSAVSDEVKAYAEACGLALENVKQGYTKCSCAVIGNALVTADRGIYAAAKQHGSDALLISSGSIGIESYDTGFIGGASAVLNETTIGFFGDLDGHPSGKEIRAFLESHGVRAVSLSDEPLFDYGGAVRVEIS